MKKNKETLDNILEGKLKIIQKKDGYRFSIDSILLANFINNINLNQKIIELGVGSGIISLIMCHKYKCFITGVELQNSLINMALKNFKLNKLEKLITLIKGDICKIKYLLPSNLFDIVFFNPPYFKKESGKININTEKAIAKHEIHASITDFILAAKYLIRDLGKIYTIYPVKNCIELFLILHKFKFEPKKIRFVHFIKTMQAELVLVQAIKGAKKGLQILSPLFLKNEEKNIF